MVLRLLCLPSDASGMSSSMKTQTIAPAAKARKYGRAGVMREADSTTVSPLKGSTAPMSLQMRLPMRKGLMSGRF